MHDGEMDFSDDTRVDNVGNLSFYIMTTKSHNDRKKNQTNQLIIVLITCSRKLRAAVSMRHQYKKQYTFSF